MHSCSHICLHSIAHRPKARTGRTAIGISTSIRLIGIILQKHPPSGPLSLSRCAQVCVCACVHTCVHTCIFCLCICVYVCVCLLKMTVAFRRASISVVSVFASDLSPAQTIKGATAAHGKAGHLPYHSFFHSKRVLSVATLTGLPGLAFPI